MRRKTDIRVLKYQEIVVERPAGLASPACVTAAFGAS